MNQASIKQWFFCATLLTTFLAANAQATQLEQIFNGDILGVTQRHFESVIATAGIPSENEGDHYQLAIEGCDVQVVIRNNSVQSLRLALTPACQADLSSFGFNRSTRGLTFGYFTSGKYPEA